MDNIVKIIESKVEKIVGSWDWSRQSKESKDAKCIILYNFVQEIISDFASLRVTSCNYDEIAGDTWTIDESDFQRIFKKYTLQDTKEKIGDGT